jgi:predicted CoA-substrate-specific enzyme activase
MSTFQVGLDIGSTTAKMVVLDSKKNVVFSRYKRHQANIKAVLKEELASLRSTIGAASVKLKVTGSVGMGVAEKFKLAFEQEVIAATKFVKEKYPEVATLIDIGGEDAKIVYIKPDGSCDLRMNGNCAGGTGAFLDQMAVLLNVPIEDLNALAEKAQHIHYIASRCGVFAKTDIQNLLSKGVSREDIAASIYHAVAVQVITTLSHGCTINPKILLCGGPLTFMPALRKALMDALQIPYVNFIVPENANLIPAYGTAISAADAPAVSLEKLIDTLASAPAETIRTEDTMPPIFQSAEAYAAWKKEKEADHITLTPLTSKTDAVYVGIDSGSTTTKLVVTDPEDRILFTHYAANNGNPVGAVQDAFGAFYAKCLEVGANPRIVGSCSTGYGEDLIKAAFNLNTGIIETIAHYLAARKINKDVSFILDIGGQDMKAIFVDHGVLNRMELNESCSSGCGTFLETFAKGLNYSVGDFATLACEAKHPCDLGTRCTVFMNSKVKQSLREGVTSGDIAAGLAYSVVRNCLYKVLKLKSVKELGNQIVLQGGTMKNDAVVRAFEILTDTKVHRSNIPEIMGAYGCALFAKTRAKGEATLDDMIHVASYKDTPIQCHGCENNCLIKKYQFSNGSVYFSGNKCEKFFTNNGDDVVPGENVYNYKYDLLFNRPVKEDAKRVIGIPRCLNIYEDYPFWHALFTTCGLKVQLSDPSTLKMYESGLHDVMSDNICFPAKLVHGHILNLIQKRVNRIFMPYVIYERQDDKRQLNSYNCPVVSGYSDVIKSVTDTEIPIDSPPINFQDEKMLKKQLRKYLNYIGFDRFLADKAIKNAMAAQGEFRRKLRAKNQEILDKSRKEGKLTILLAGRPYHTDPLVQHKLSDTIAAMGINVISEDLVRDDSTIEINDSYLVRQWAYINRIIKAADWVARQDNTIHFMEMTSFGCGPDAFLQDEIRTLLQRHGKALTLLKIDDVSNIGSLKLRVRSVVESIRYNQHGEHAVVPFVDTPRFEKNMKDYTILTPYFTPTLSPLIPSVMSILGYHVETLPESTGISADLGLKFANNEVCYPATLVVGDFIRALRSGRYDLHKTAVAITQTGGQCRASNYFGLIKHALVSAGFQDTPVISLATSSNIENDQPGFHINWLKVAKITVSTILFSDCLSKFYNATVVREVKKGLADSLRSKYLELAKKEIEANHSKGLLKLLKEAAGEFAAAAKPNVKLPQVGIVGEIYLKFNAFAHKNITGWLMDHHIEVMPPLMTPFFMQAFVNRLTNYKFDLKHDKVPRILVDFAYIQITKMIAKFNKASSSFPYFTPFEDIYEMANNGKGIINMAAQFGEGWLLPAEVVGFAKAGIYNVISLQPFGCIANHIIAKGIEKKVKTLYPQMNLLSLDFDSGVSDVNVTNRLLLFVENIRSSEHSAAPVPKTHKGNLENRVRQEIML